MNFLGGPVQMPINQKVLGIFK